MEKFEDIPVQTKEDFATMIRSSEHERYKQGDLQTKEDISNLRKLIQMTQEEFAIGLGVSTAAVQDWEQGRKWPSKPVLILMRLAAKSPRSIHQRVKEERTTAA